MKCKNCGGEIRLEDMYCPYCGSPNEEARRHALDMQHYRQEFQETREDVIERAGKHTGRAVRFAAVAILLLAITANIVLQMNSYTLQRIWQESRIKKDAPVYREKMEAWLEAEDYCGFASFCANHHLLFYDGPFRDYYVIYRMASNYRYAVMDIMRLINHGPYTDVDRLIESTSEGIQDFYEDLDPDKYPYYGNYDTAFVQGHIKKMTENMNALCMAYLDLTPEEAQSLPTLSRGSRIVLIEKGLARYAGEEEEPEAGTKENLTSGEAETAEPEAGASGAGRSLTEEPETGISETEESGTGD